MSQLLIQQYLNELAKLRQVSGTDRESVVREAFKDLLKGWARSFDLTFVPEYQLDTRTRERRYVDGALLHTLRVPFGYWEAKDSRDDLDSEIDRKFRAGYPKTNIIFEDSTQAVLIQHGEEVMRCGVEDVAALEKLLKLFFGYERPEIEAFRKAVGQFKSDLPAVLEALRAMIERAHRDEPEFRQAAQEFLAHAHEAINPSLADADVREMLIQHILTGEVFAAVFPGTTYHEDNNVARELHKLEATFFTGNTKYQTLKGLEPYYAAIRKAASEIATHHEKQTFLKAIYENFYKVYNPKAADRLGVVYTPNEIVRFMIESADWLCRRHFDRGLIDADVDILDPAAGTGTFICELLEHFRGQPARLRHKYERELHANEVAILPYYVANLNIEATYASIAGEYREYPNLCFVDTLDNTYALRKYRGHIDDLFGAVSDDNVKRIRRQNSRRISVILGNPPYNANQLNENENNKNREYPEIDKRIRETYIAASSAQKTKLYDMYARFFRWAADRLDENGVLALVTNRSFIDSRTFDGFRACAAREFNEIRVVDLGGDVRANPKLSGTKHNVFGIQTGVAISFMVKRAKQKGCRIFYARRPELEAAEEKLAFLGAARLDAVAFEEIQPDRRHNWINLAQNDFDTLLPIATREAKAAKTPAQEKAIFKLYSLGVVTNRDEWVYDEDRQTLERKVHFFCDAYKSEAARWRSAGRPVATGDFVDRAIKWTSELEAHMRRGTSLSFDPAHVVESLYRPFVRRYTYFAPVVTHRPYQNFSLFPPGHQDNIGFSFGVEERAAFGVIATDRLPNKDMFLPSAAQVACLWRFDEDGRKVDNITDWALEKFRKHYRSLPQRGRAGEGVPERAAEGPAEDTETAAPHLFRPAPLPEGLRARARELRGKLTDAEQMLWQCLRREALGVKFRRQHPIDPYVLDFYCVEEKLAVEVDGGQHAEDPARAHDAKRDAFLRKRGIRTLRFWNNEVLGNPEGALETIMAGLGREEPASQPSPRGTPCVPPPRPSPAGGGGFVPSPGGRGEITKGAIFHYVYAVLHDPVYREKYALNLKRDFPRIPFYPDFWRWADWGRELMELHVGYESVEAWPLERVDKPLPSPPAPLPPGEGSRRGVVARSEAPKPLLKADREGGRILLDSQTTLAGVPPEAWDYRLGNRCALEWVLDQYKEKRPKDPTIRAQFDSYRFADHKEKVVDLLARVVAVSVRTMAIVRQMERAAR